MSKDLWAKISFLAKKFILLTKFQFLSEFFFDQHFGFEKNFDFDQISFCNQKFLFLLKSSNFSLNFTLYQNFYRLTNFTQFSIFSQNFHFGSKISIFDPNFHFWPKFPFLTKIFIFYQLSIFTNFHFLANFNYFFVIHNFDNCFRRNTGNILNSGVVSLFIIFPSTVCRITEKT